MKLNATKLKCSGHFYPRESFCEDYGITGVRLSVRLFVCLLPRKLNKKWMDLDGIFWEGSWRKSKRKFVCGYDR